MPDDAPLPSGVQMSMDFDNPHNDLPPQEDFPLTIKEAGRLIKRVIEADINRSENCLIVTGFTSLAQIIETFGVELPQTKTVRILFGFELVIRPRKRWKEAPLSQELKEYWLSKGISPFQCGAVIKTIDCIQKGQLVFKLLDKLHAKLYVTEGYATLGSSNFSHSGLTVQHEANFRAANNSESGNGYHYHSIKKIADYYWQRGKLYSDEIIDLLNQLLIVVDWQEALARAVAELLEGEYVKDYLKTFEQTNENPLWPSQAIGIHQGLQVLQDMGSLLVADPTGSGKTKMITVLQLAMLNWLWETGRGLHVNSIIITPPLVIQSWKKEQLSLGRLLPEPISQGILSWRDTLKYNDAMKALRLANFLVIDEAHNFLNKNSRRSLSISTHRAEFIILSTATPINKRAEDLLRLVQLLDPDNLGDEELAQFKKLYAKPLRDLEESETVVKELKSYIWKFTLRRTKTDLNKLITKEPEKYLNELGEKCRYPEQNHQFYPTGEAEQDIAIAETIEQLSSNLKGLIYLKTISFPKGRNLDTIEKRRDYIQARLNTAKGLSRYRVQAALRSSRAALVELIEGTRRAEEYADLPTIGKDTGDILRTLNDMQIALPQYSKAWDVLPEWLTNKQLFQQACAEERKTYRKIAELVRLMSDAREKAKAATLLMLMRKHSLVVAFDHTIISLHCFQKLLQEKEVKPYVVWSTNTSAKQKVLDSLSLGSDAKNLIALCSDAVSEGVNLQAAKAVMMLDMPSVLRLAEQRIGRIDRLNSPHKAIHVYWPEDSKTFQLKADQKLIRTAHITEQLMGSNLNLPEEMFSGRYEDLTSMSSRIVVDELEKSRREQEVEWTGMKDAFEDVRLLVEGPTALLTEVEYRRMMNINASVRCKLSFVKSEKHWTFIAIRSSKESVSRWLFIDEDEEVTADFSVICRSLRQRLQGAEKEPFNEKELKHFIRLFRQKEREILPHKKRRALKVAEAILQRQLKENEKNGDPDLLFLIKNVLDLFKPTTKDIAVDYHRFGEQWLTILSIWLKEWRESKNQRRWLSLEDLISRKDKKCRFNEEQLQNILFHVPVTDPLELQIAACIIGVGRE